MAVSYTLLNVKAQALCVGSIAAAAWFARRKSGVAAFAGRIVAGGLVTVLLASHAFVGAVKWHARTVDERARRLMEMVSIGMPLGEVDSLLSRHVRKIVVDSTEVRYVFRRLASCEPFYGPPSYAVNTDKAGLITKVRTLERD